MQFQINQRLSVTSLNDLTWNHPSLLYSIVICIKLGVHFMFEQSEGKIVCVRT